MEYVNIMQMSFVFQLEQCQQRYNNGGFYWTVSWLILDPYFRREHKIISLVITKRWKLFCLIVPSSVDSNSILMSQEIKI